MKKTFTILLLSIIFSSCKKNGCLDESGAMISITRPAASIREIKLYDNIDLILRQDSVESIRVEAGQNLEPFIETSFEKDVLTIRNNIECNWLRDPAETIHVYVSVVDLEKLDYEGSGNVTSVNTLLADNITFYSELGAGNIEVSVKAHNTSSYLMDENADFVLHGSTDQMWSYTNSRGTIDFSDFAVKKMVIEYGGVRDAKIHVTQELDAIIYFKGNLYYKGNPDIIKNVQHSTGKLIRLP